jgi:hypothetical protein
MRLPMACASQVDVLPLREEELVLVLMDSRVLWIEAGSKRLRAAG